MVLPEETKRDTFADFVAEVEPRLRQALISALGPELGREATAEALAYGWTHWERLGSMDNAVGYLYRVGRSKGTRLRGRRVGLPAVNSQRLPWVEPGLPAALALLSEQQRIVVLLLHAYDWTMSEVANGLGISKASVQTHERRAMRRLRRRLKVDV